MNPSTAFQDQLPAHQEEQAPPFKEGWRHALGQPSITATSAGARKNILIPAKDANRRITCPHCVRTYLHVKRLKRHLVRRKL
jgi:hypothetical protein